jgi:hypothetical protein
MVETRFGRTSPSSSRLRSFTRLHPRLQPRNPTRPTRPPRHPTPLRRPSQRPSTSSPVSSPRPPRLQTTRRRTSPRFWCTGPPPPEFGPAFIAAVDAGDECPSDSESGADSDESDAVGAAEGGGADRWEWRSEEEGVYGEFIGMLWWLYVPPEIPPNSILFWDDF